MSKHNEHYSIKRIKEKNAKYNVIFGERSNGKTYAVLESGLIDYKNTGALTGIIRRWDTDFTGANSSRTAYDSLSCNGDGENRISEIFNGEYTGVTYYSGRYYLTRTDDESGKLIKTDKCVAYAFSINSSEHYKSGSFPGIKTILFDEFITRKYYLPDEFVEFQNLLSTIIRQRDDVTIYMCGNTVNKYGCPYYTEMGLTHIKDMEVGSIELYTYGDTGLTVAVEYSDSPNKKKKSDIYFAFDNPRLKMITTGAWEIDIYPHAPCKWLPKEVVFVFFIIYEDITLQCDIISKTTGTFIFIHAKTTELKAPNKDLIYQVGNDYKHNTRRKITIPTTPTEAKIYNLFKNDKVFYQNNEIGEIVRNYLIWCRKTAT